MNVSDEIRKTLSDPKPFYALAGAGDLAAEKLKDAPERLREAPTLLAEAGATLTSLANKIATEGPERLAKVTSSVQDAAGKGRPDAEALRGIAQTVAIQQVGRLLEAAGKAVETYDELAERGKIVVGRYAGVASETAEDEGGFAESPVTVLVEQVTDEDDLLTGEDDLIPDEEGQFADGYGFAQPPAQEEAEPAASAPQREESAQEAAEAFEQRPESAAEAAQVFEEAAEAEAAEKPTPKKSAPRKRAAGPKTPRPPKN